MVDDLAIRRPSDYPKTAKEMVTQRHRPDVFAAMERCAACL
jgi:hypothetical protein